MYVTIQKKRHVYRYHIEFQTLNDLSMAIRMFRYGFEKAEEVSNVGSQDEIRLEFPRQLVIFLEENENIKDQLAFILGLPDGQDIRYTVPVMKYWRYTAEDLKRAIHDDITYRFIWILEQQEFAFHHAVNSILPATYKILRI